MISGLGQLTGRIYTFLHAISTDRESMLSVCLNPKKTFNDGFTSHWREVHQVTRSYVHAYNADRNIHIARVWVTWESINF